MGIDNKKLMEVDGNINRVMVSQLTRGLFDFQLIGGNSNNQIYPGGLLKQAPWSCKAQAF